MRAKQIRRWCSGKSVGGRGYQLGLKRDLRLGTEVLPHRWGIDSRLP